ncbi:nucleoporin NUP152 [Prunus avium]|uniref:Nucleoporin NUP152 n=1 Tax=Prunus avium TaxID=42229 RepID=A0A6P5RKX5_PRUAV|nr:nucleoporin NUP152 [Prunus avium]
MMTKGTKRFALSDSNPDSAFRNKRIMAGSSCDANRAEPSQEQSIDTPVLNAHRAASSRQHVRALNTQFASWVQMQLKNHPDELWEDGLRDYLAHASNIMEKFSDVVNWLKVNAGKGENLAGAPTAEKKMVPESTNKDKYFQPKPLFAPVGTTANFASSGLYSNSQSSAGVFSNNHCSTGEYPFRQRSEGVSSNSQSPSGVFSSQSSPALWSSGVFSSSQSSTGVFTNNHSSTGELPTGESSAGVSSNSQSSSGVFSSQISPVFSSVQSSGIFSNTQSSGVFSNSQSSVAFSKTPSFGLFSNSQSSGLSSNSQSSATFSSTPSFGLFSYSQSSGLSSNSQPPALFGTQSSVPTKHDASDEADVENDLEQPSSPSVKKSEEKGVVLVHEVKCKLYVKSSDPADKDAWKDKGTGQLSIKCKEGVSKGTKESKPTIIVRNDVGKVQLNALLYSGIKTNLQKNSIVAIFHTMGESDGNDGSAVARTFLIRLKTEEDRNKLATAIQEYAPAS